MKAVLGFILGLTVALSLTAFAGENPLHILFIFIRSTFGSPYDLGLTLFYTTTLILTGLAVAVPFQAGLFNIGAEGQMTVATLACAWFAISQPNVPVYLAPLLATAVALFAGAMWAFIPGWLKAKRGSHEVIVTMMMNFVAAAFASYVTLILIKNPDSQNPETAMVPAQYMFKNFDFVQKLFRDSPANITLLVAIALAFALHFFFYRTVWGFELRASGQNEVSSELHGIESKKYKILAMLMGGACAGLVALNEVLGSSGKFQMGFSPGYGFIGIAVALLAQNRPIAILASAFLFGLLQKGAADLDLETETITRDFAKIIQAILIFSVAISATWGHPKWSKFLSFFKTTKKNVNKTGEMQND